MMLKPVINKISIYPVKSLDGVSLQKAEIGKGGCLLHDREYAIKDCDNRYVNGKKNALVHLLRMKMDFENETIFFRHESETGWHEFHLPTDKTKIDDYLSLFFNMPVTLHKNLLGRFLDVPDKSGMTILSTASLQTVAHWFNDIDLEETRKRFRATLEIADVPSFWEDHLFFEERTAIAFKIGDVHVLGMSPRARCVVPTRHPQNGEVIQGFQKSFSTYRKAELPQWSALENFGHTYYLSVDCLIPPSEFGKQIAVGDEIIITGKKKLTGPVFL